MNEPLPLLSKFVQPVDEVGLAVPGDYSVELETIRQSTLESEVLGTKTIKTAQEIDPSSDEPGDR